MLKTLRSRDLMETLEGIKVKPLHMLGALGGILILAYVVVGVSYLRELSEQPALREQVEAGGGTLSGVGDSQETLKGLQDELADLQDELVSLENSFPAKLDSTAIVQSFVDYARESSVSIRQMNALPETEAKAEKDGEAAYSVLRYTLIIEGGQTQMLAFLSRLEKETAQKAALGEVEVINDATANQMTLSVSFYSRPEQAGAAAKASTPQPATGPATTRSKPN